MNITLGRDKCIWMFPSHQWNKVLETLSTTNPYTEQEVMMRRQMLFHTEELTIDSQHRILIPQEILTKVSVKKEVLLIGQLERIEIWNPATYEKYLKESPDTYEGVMQKVMEKLYSTKPNG
jgi:MraZ protein